MPRSAAICDRLLWQTVLLGLAVALVVVFRLRFLERRSEQSARSSQMRQLSQQLVNDAGRRTKEPLARAP